MDGCIAWPSRYDFREYRRGDADEISSPRGKRKPSAGALASLDQRGYSTAIED
jgi:hypothetical protein